jgi:TonB family protein
MFPTRVRTTLGTAVLASLFAVPGVRAQPWMPLGHVAPDSLRRAWVSRIATGDSILLRHVETREQPVPFETRVPSIFALTYEHAEGALIGPGAGVVARLVAEGLAASDGDCGRSKCADSSSFQDEITLGFRSEGDTLRVSLDSRTPRIMVRDARRGAFACFGRAALFRAIVDSLAAYLPDDVRLGDVSPCLESNAPRKAPGYGGFVNVETFPEVVQKDPPEYPEESRRSSIEAIVYVRALINQQGRVTRTALDGATHDLRPFQRAAVAAIEKWRFKPATSDGQPITVWVLIPIRFKLN